MRAADDDRSLSPRGEGRGEGGQPARLSRAASLALAALVFASTAAIYLLTAPGPGLIEPDEARYAEMAREMLVTGDWITPRVNFVEYFQKPPLVAWASAAAFAALGVTEQAARLPSVVAALGSVAVVGVLAARMYGLRCAPLAMLGLATAPLFALLGVTLTLDTSFAFLITLALAAAWGGIASGRRRWWRVAAVATALAVLAKGFAAIVIVGLVAGAHLLWHEGWRGVRRALDPLAPCLGVAVMLPWLAVMGCRHAGFLDYFVLEQHLGRYVGNVDHPLPFWFLPAVLPLLLFPWGLLPVLDPRCLRPVPPPRAWMPATRFLVLWAAVVVGFFSFASSKLPNYVLPGLAPLAILLARLVQRTVAERRLAGLARVGLLLVVGGLLTGLAGAIVPLASSHWRALALAPYLYAGGLALAVTGAAVRWLLVWRGLPSDAGADEAAPSRLAAAVVVLAVGMLCVTAVVLAGRSVATSYRDLGLAARAHLRPGDRLAVFRRNVHGLTFYARARAMMIGGPGELRFGFEYGEHQAWFRPEHELLELWGAPGRMFLVLTRRELDALEPPLDPPPILVAAEHKKLLVVNRE